MTTPSTLTAAATPKTKETAMDETTTMTTTETEESRKARREARWARQEEVAALQTEFTAKELAGAPARMAAIDAQRDAVTKWHVESLANQAQGLANQKEWNTTVMSLLREQNALLARIVAALEAKG